MSSTSQRTDYLTPEDQTPYPLGAEFARRWGRAISTFGNVEPNQYPIPGLTLDPRVGAHFSLHDLSSAPFRTVGLSWRAGGLLAAVAANGGQIRVAVAAGANVIAVIDEFRYSTTAPILHGFGPLALIQQVAVSMVERGARQIIGTTAVPAPPGIQVSAINTVVGVNVPDVVVGAEQGNATSMGSLAFGDLCLFPGDQSYLFCLQTVNVAMVWSIRGRYFPVLAAGNLPDFGGS